MASEEQQRPDREIEKSITQAISVQAKTIGSLDNKETIKQISQVANAINKSSGRVAFSGIGKSGDVAQKIVDTFNSIGVTSHFVHPVEALHGDLGTISSEDVIIFVSNSGETDEVTELQKFVNHFDPTTVAITSNPDSELAQSTRYHINTGVTDEGSLIDLIPMASATATMVIGDCIANALMAIQDFDRTEYGHFHPGGTIGKRLLLDVEDLLYTKIPRTERTDSLAEVAVDISDGSKGVAVIRDDHDIVHGILTDGDIRRLVETGANFHDVVAEDVMTTDPITVSLDTSAIRALEIIEEQNITQLVVTNEEDCFEGMIHIHDIMSEGLTT